MLSDLQVDVNGQESFSVSKKILASLSGKLRKMFGKSATNITESLKLIFQDFPGGAEGFELIVRFCYNGGRIDITPCNVVLLHSAARYLEIKEDQTTKYFQIVHFWTWSELLHCLRQCQEFSSLVKSSTIVEEILNAVVEKISMSRSPFDFSCSDYSGDVSTNSSSRSSSFLHTANLLGDLEFLNTEFFDKVLSTMISEKLDHGVVCSLLVHYQKVRFVGLLAADERCRIVEVVITCLSSLNGGFRVFPFRNLCDILRACLTLKMGRFWLRRVERMIGSRLDEATLDDLMIPCHGRKVGAYDVSLIMRFLKVFLGECRGEMFVPRLKRVGFLMDLYLAEVAPDPHLRPSKFLALALALPDSARHCCDTLSQVVHLYFKVHRFMSEEEKIRICSILNYGKLSSESLLYLAKNAEFPACVGAAALQILAKDDKSLEFRLDYSLAADEDEHILVHLPEGIECRKMQNFSSDFAKINVRRPKSDKSLPMLCS
ncbi:BTB/POZ domain-containing protein At3g22104-like [Salvia miltiorrhiza]|uniref:BTB/POZ domain-containing protein At3g22104-like n=1 Tax=Salvia miltiorrhiza TaxID=226208 RepID=UPI0025AD6C09|nr:BTB/POZ domain-containing protein At3g22104-like [Salvia miltiorrhiza]